VKLNRFKQFKMRGPQYSMNSKPLDHYQKLIVSAPEASPQPWNANLGSVVSLKTEQLRSNTPFENKSRQSP